MVTKAFHGAGLVVPVDKNDVGYRELPETNGKYLGYCILCFTEQASVIKLLCKKQTAFIFPPGKNMSGWSKKQKS